MSLCPITLGEAHAFVTARHRHHAADVGALFAIAAVQHDAIVGVVVIGRAKAWRLDLDDYTAEVTRLCTDGTRNACSMLYGAAWRAWRSMGGRRLVTYTLQEEGGASLRGAGWTLIGEAGGGSWSRRDRPRVDTHPMQEKLRWERVA